MAKRKFPEKKPVEPFEAPEVTVDERPEAMRVPASEQIAKEEEICASCSVVYGVVTGCKLLNVRSKPDISGTVKGLLSEECEVFINEEKSTKDWYYISTGLIEGYCMRKYVSVTE